MKTKQRTEQRSLILVLLASTAACSTLPIDEPEPSAFASEWSTRLDGTWLGPDYWANRLQDWRVSDGRAECTGTALPYRTLHLTTWRLEAAGGECTTRIVLGAVDPGSAMPLDAEAGILVGAGSAELDPRAACLVQSAPGPDGGFLAGIDGGGNLFVRDFAVADPDRDPGARVSLPIGREALQGLELVCRVAGAGGAAGIQVTAFSADGGRLLGALRMDRIEPVRLHGGLALVSHPGAGEQRGSYWFRDWRADGTLLVYRPEQRLGPVVGTLYTQSRGRLKLTAQLVPLGPEDDRRVELQVQEQGRWRSAAVTEVQEPGYVATFAVDDWPSHREVPYRVVYRLKDKNGDFERHEFEGTVRADPVGEDRLVMAAMSCTHQVRHGFGRPGYPWNGDALWFPHRDLTGRIAEQSPDLLFFAGDQIYEGASPTPPDRSGDPHLDYLYKWYLWLWAFRDLTRDIPTVTIPDDHDVYQGNLWGAGGRRTDRDNKGGYVMPAEWVKMVERTQTSHLPDPFDPTPVEQGIGVYYTQLVYGGIGFAILEDRKFKSGPAGLVKHGGPRPDHVTDPDFDPVLADVPGATLLGERQLAFLDAWARDWDGCAMKAVLSQTVFANVATHHGPRQQRLVADLDSNGWPQTGRNRALAAIRKAFAVMICGDQHLATVVQHGIDEHRDAGWSFTVPAVANFYLRAWLPEEPGANRLPGLPAYTGDYRDGLGNRVTVRAATNPGPVGREPAALHDQKPGYGLVVFDKAERTTTFECWPRYADPAVDPQYEGWPIRVAQRDNYRRRPAAWLPALQIRGMVDPVVVVEDPRGGLVYALRVRGDTFRPWAFEEGRHVVKVGEPGTARVAVLELQARAESGEVLQVVVPSGEREDQ